MQKLKKLINKLIKGSYEGLVFPVTHKQGIQVRFNMYDLKRKFLKDRWKYIAVTNTLIIIIGAFYIIQLRETIQAATYGFNQTDWSGGASTTAVALHDTDQDNYDKYYSNDSNINATSNQINLTYASTTLFETSTSDFNNGVAVSGTIMHENGELKMGCPSGFEFLFNNNFFYCRSTSCLTSTQCSETVNTNFLSGSVINVDCDTQKALRTISCSYPYSGWNAIQATNNGIGLGTYIWTGNYGLNNCGNYNQPSTQCIIGFSN